MTQFKIEQVAKKDIELLIAISTATFTETFSVFNTEQNMRAYLEKAFSLEKLQEELEDPGSDFYFIYVGEELAGYVKLNMGIAQTERMGEGALEIERIYVLGAFQGKKLGQLLLEKVIEIAKQQQCTYIWLGVWEKNRRAIRFYEKNGFIPFDKHIFRLGDDEQTDIMMKKILRFTEW